MIAEEEFAETEKLLNEARMKPGSDGNYAFVMHPLAWQSLMLSKIFDEYKEFLMKYEWSKWRKRLWPRLTGHERTQAILWYMITDAIPEEE